MDAQGERSCSAATEKLLGTGTNPSDQTEKEKVEKCRKTLDQQPSLIKNTILKLIEWSCSKDVRKFYSECAVFGSACSAVNPIQKRDLYLVLVNDIQPHEEVKKWTSHYSLSSLLCPLP